MTQAEPTRLNIRSRFARKRAAALARETGMTLTQVVKEALRAYQPARGTPGHETLTPKAGILVKPRTGRTVSSAEVEAALVEGRDERG